LDGLFDDPIRKVAKVIKERVSAEELMIYEKSKKGLADIYEEDFKIDVLGASANPEDDANQEEIDTLCESLFYELDQLSNFHFTPKPVNTEAKVLT
jgi:U3 small nucleolar RNA-associated protein MPP10